MVMKDNRSIKTEKTVRENNLKNPLENLG